VLEAVWALLLGVHLLLVDVAMAGPLVCAWLDWRQCRHEDLAAGRAGLTLARLTNWTLAGGIVVGLVLLGARWQIDGGRYFGALAAVPRSRLWFAGAELLFFFACMGAYVGLWNRWRKWRWLHRLLAVAAATNLLLHFPALFAIVSIVETRPELVGQTLDRAAFQRMLLDGEVVSRVLHVWLAALAVTGAVVMELGLRMRREESLGASAERLIRSGAVLALVPTLLQIPVGFWLTMRMPETARAPLLGGDLVATALFAVSLVLALALMHALAGIALGNDASRQIRRSIAVLCTLVILMAATHSRVDQPTPAADAVGAPATAVVDVACSRPQPGDLHSDNPAFQ
jgi:hypothetical protein